MQLTWRTIYSELLSNSMSTMLNSVIRKSRGVVDDMNRNWVSRLLFYNRKDNKPPPVEWNNRNEEELGSSTVALERIDH